MTNDNPMIGQTISHYKILEKLGEGGMGVVYKAEDLNLKRTVALKFLPDRVNRSEVDKARFLQEAQAAAALNHNNICTIYGVEEFEKQIFISMEYIDGGTLREKLPFANVSNAITAALEIARALQEAHARGIVHRDIKADNIMVTSKGQVKVMDFGLAKLKGSLKLTQTSSTVGTLAYMAPEQMQGEEADPRSDIFSFGVLLYEMLTGKLPFRGEHEAAIMYSIVNEEPLPLSQFNISVPEGLSQILNRLLEKDPAARYQSMQDVMDDLISVQGSGTVSFATQKSRRLNQSSNILFRPAIVIPILILIIAAIAYVFLWGHGAATIDSIAVLPFTNVGENKDLEYMSDGITESLINSLSEISSLRVLPRSTVFQFKGQEAQAQKIGIQLGVKAVLSGRVVSRGNTLNVQVELIDVQKQAQLWGEQYKRNTADIITVQEEIAKQISEKLFLRLTGEEEKRFTKRSTENVEAYQLYLKGRYHWAKRSAEDLNKAVVNFNAAIQLDPGYALAYSGLADAYDILGVLGEQSPGVAFPRAKAAAGKALEIDPTLSEAYATLADLSIHHDWDWNAAESNFRKAIQLDPAYAVAHHWYSEYLALMLRHDEAIAETKKAAELDPLALMINTFVGWNYYHARKYDSAITAFGKVLEIDQRFAWAHLWLGESYLQIHRQNDAINHILLASQSNDNQMILAYLGWAYGRAGRLKEAQIILDTLTNRSKRHFVSAYSFTLVYLGTGNKDKTFEWLEKSYLERASWLPFISIDPIWDPLRKDERFGPLLARMGLGK